MFPHNGRFYYGVYGEDLVDDFQNAYTRVYGRPPLPFSNLIGIAPPSPIAAIFNYLEVAPPHPPPPPPPPAAAIINPLRVAPPPVPDAATNVDLVIPDANIARGAPGNPRQPAAATNNVAVAVKAPKRKRKRGPDPKTWVPLCYRERKRDVYYYATDANMFHLK